MSNRTLKPKALPSNVLDQIEDICQASFKNLGASLAAMASVVSLGVIAYYIVDENIKQIFEPGKFFSYFTVQTGILFSATSLRRWWRLVRRQESNEVPHSRNVWRFCVTVYALIILPIYWLTQVPFDKWIDEFSVSGWWVIHLLMPVLAGISWIIDPPKIPQTKQWLLWPLLSLGYVLLFSVYTIIHGLVTGWYPYDFFNIESSGLGNVMLFIGAMSTGISVLGYALLTPLRPWRYQKRH